MWEQFDTGFFFLFLPFCRSQQVDKFWCLRTHEKVEPRGEMEVERETTVLDLPTHWFSTSGLPLTVSTADLNAGRACRGSNIGTAAYQQRGKNAPIQLALRVTRNHYFGKQPVHTLWEMMYMESRQQVTPATTFTHSKVNIEQE